MKNGAYFKLPATALKFGILFLFILFNSVGNIYSQTTRVSIQQSNITIKDALSLLEKNARVVFFYADKDVELNKKVSLNFRDQPISVVLDEMFRNSINTYKIEGKQIYITRKPKVAETERLPEKKKVKITGMVYDETSSPVIGASIAVEGTGNGTVSDINGHFSIDIPEGARLKVYYIGYETQLIDTKGKSTLKILLNQEVKNLSEVVVVGFSHQKKATVTGSVSAIGAKDLLQSPQANISNALAGRMPGLLSVQRSGEPGKDASTIRIRGIGTFAGNQDPLVMVDGVETANYNNIDPNEIESFSILKDASATAVYGVRGANGVILITTKRGEVGKPKVSLSTNVAMSNFPFLRENMNSYEYATSYNKAKAYDSYVTGNYMPAFTDEQIEKYRTHSDPILYPDIDWYDYMLRDHSYQTQSNLNISGGTNKVKYFVSLGYFTQQGMLNTKLYNPGYDYQLDYKRYNLRSNFDINITKNLLASFDISTQTGDLRNPNWNINSLMENLSSATPFCSPGVIDNKIVTITTPLGAGWVPLVAFDKGWNRNYENNLNASVRVNYKMDYLLKGLALRSAISYKNTNVDSKTYSLNGMTYVAQSTDNGTVILPKGDPGSMQFFSRIEKKTNIYFEGGITYNRTFGNHNVTGLVLYNQSKTYDPYLAFLVPSGYQGLVGRATYDFKNKYLAEFNIGYNGTENFGIGRRFGTFPAYSLGWVVSEEDFMEKLKFISFLKLRASYGMVGNDKIGGSRFLYRPTAYVYYGDVYYFGEVATTRQGYLGSLEGKMGNPLLTWEKAKKLDVGIDSKFLKDKIGFSIDFFSEKRNNILWNRGTIPVLIGAEMPAYNLGIMHNSGFDGEVSYNDKIGKFSYYVKANYTYAHNKIVYQDEVARNYDYLYVTGQRFGQFFGYVAEGLYNTWEEVNDANRPVYQWSNNRIQPGDIRYKDVNGDGKIDDNDKVPIGYSNFPEVMFGMSFGGSWKGFDFSVLFQGATKVSNAPSRRTIMGFYTNTGATKALLESWSQERLDQGLPINYPRLAVENAPQNYALSTYWLEDASYVRLKNAELGYTFQGPALKKIGLSSFRLYLNGNNLLTFCNLYPGEDPEFPTSEANSEPYPATRIYNLGMKINF